MLRSPWVDGALATCVVAVSEWCSCVCLWCAYAGLDIMFFIYPLAPRPVDVKHYWTAERFRSEVKKIPRCPSLYRKSTKVWFGRSDVGYADFAEVLICAYMSFKKLIKM